MNSLSIFKKGVQAGIPIALGYFAVSFSFGMICVTNGLSVFDAVLISLTNLTSAGQFAGLKIIVSSGTYLEILLSQLIINLRYSLMSFSLSQKLDNKHSFFYRYLIAFGVTDEIFAVSINQNNKLNPYFNLGCMAIAIPGWTLGTLFGSLLGNVLPSIVTSALSVSLYGMFIAIIIPPSKKDKNILYAIICAMLLSSLMYYLPFINISSGFSIIIVTLLVSFLFAYLKPIKEEEYE